MRGLILFDIDGTLLRVGDLAHQQALVAAMREVFDVPVDLDGVPLAGMLDSQIARIALQRKQVPPDEIRDGLARVMETMELRYRELISGQDRRDWVLPGIVELSSRLAENLALAVMTGNARGVARAKLKSSGLDELFPIGSYGDSASQRHELVGVALAAARECFSADVKTPRTVIVGDTPRDIEAARVAGVSVVAVATGRFSVDDLRSDAPDLLYADLAYVDRVEAELRSLIAG